jgi:serine/threonine protein kinase
MMRERQIFQNAVEIAGPAERKDFVRHACGPDEALRGRVENLLQAAGAMADFLAAPVLEKANAASADSQTDQSVPPELDLSIATAIEEHETAEVPSFKSVLAALRPLLGATTYPGSLGRLSHYELLEIVGQGAFGIVFKGFDEKLRRVVAIKVLLPSLAGTSPPRKRFLREARAAASIRHENVVSVYSVEEEPIPFLVMEWISGANLQERIDESGPLETSEIFALVRQLLAGLEAAHHVGVIHRDIKPSNILVEEGAIARLRITDFGLARTVDDAKLSQTGYIAGTPMFMSPEQALGRPLAATSDLFSVGSVLYAMLTGRAPFRAPSTVAVLRRVVEETPRPVEQITPETPGWVRGIIRKLHAKEPADRFQSASEVRALWEACESKQAGGEAVPSELVKQWSLGDASSASEPQIKNALLNQAARIPRSSSESALKTRDRTKSKASATLILLIGCVVIGISALIVFSPSARVQFAAWLGENSSGLASQKDRAEAAAQDPPSREGKSTGASSFSGPVSFSQSARFRLLRGGTREELRAWAAGLAQDFIIESLNPRFGTNPMLIDAVAVPNRSKSPWLLHDVDNSEADFQQMWNTHRPAWRMQVLDGFGKPPRTIFLWVADSPYWRTFEGSREEIHAQKDERSVESFYPTSLFGCRNESVETWTLTQAPLPGAECEFHADIGAKELAVQLEQARQRGWRPLRLMQHVGFIEPRFALVVRDNHDKTPWEYALALREEELQQQLTDQQAKGLYPAIVASSLTDVGLRYRVVWNRFDP